MAPLGPSDRRPRRLDVDRRPGDRRRDERGRGRLAVPVGVRLGRGGGDLRARRTDLALPRPVLDPVRHRGVGHPAGRRKAVGCRDVPRAARQMAGDRRLRRRGVDRARPEGRPERPVHRPRRLHGADAGDDGPVRPRHLALARRGVHGLVPAAGPDRAVRADRRGRPRSTAAVLQRTPRAGLGARRCRHGRARRRLDPV